MKTKDDNNNNLTIAQQTILRSLRSDRDVLRVHAAYFADIFSLQQLGLVTFNDITEEHWRGFEVRRVSL